MRIAICQLIISATLKLRFCTRLLYEKTLDKEKCNFVLRAMVQDRVLHKSYLCTTILELILSPAFFIIEIIDYFIQIY